MNFQVIQDFTSCECFIWWTLLFYLLLHCYDNLSTFYQHAQQYFGRNNLSFEKQDGCHPPAYTYPSLIIQIKSPNLTAVEIEFGTSSLRGRVITNASTRWFLDIIISNIQFCNWRGFWLCWLIVLLPKRSDTCGQIQYG